MDPLIKTFSKKIGLWQANYSQSGTFLWKPYFSYRAIWGLFTRDIPSPPSQWRRFGIPSGFFFPTKNELFICFNDKTWPQASGDALTCPPGFFPTKIRLLSYLHALIWYSTITQSQLGTARRRAFNLGHIPDQHAQEKISAWADPPCRYTRSIHKHINMFYIGFQIPKPI